jgi:hypothetical protein
MIYHWSRALARKTCFVGCTACINYVADESIDFMNPEHEKISLSLLQERSYKSVATGNWPGLYDLSQEKWNEQ